MTSCRLWHSPFSTHATHRTCITPLHVAKRTQWVSLVPEQQVCVSMCAGEGFHFEGFLVCVIHCGLFLEGSLTCGVVLLALC